MRRKVDGGRAGGGRSLFLAQQQKTLQMRFGRASLGNWVLSSSLLSTKVQWNPNLKRIESENEWKMCQFWHYANSPNFLKEGSFNTM